MKIAVVVSTFPDLTETFILNQITGLIDRGHQIQIFSRFKPTDSFNHPDVERYSLLKATHYFTEIPSSKWFCRIKAACWILLAFFYRPGVVIRTLRYLLGGERSFSYPILFTALSILRIHWDVIHVHFGHNGNLILPLKRIEPSTAFITMFHGHDLLMGLSDGKENYTDLFREADLILANSAYSLDRLLELGANPQRLRIHYVGIEMNKFPYRKEHPDLTQGAFRVLTICRLDEQKGLEYSIRAINRLVSTNPSISIEYRIVGGGCQEAFLKHLVEELNLSQQVYFLGPLDQEGVIRHLLNSDVFLLTSIREWLGMVLLEAQAVGLPIVATEIGGIPEAVVPGQSAILVPARNSLAAAEALTECLKNPIKRIEMGIAGRKHVEKNFDINNLNDKLECIYEDLCRSLKVTLASK